MTSELMLLAVVGVAQIAGLTVLGVMLYRMWEQTAAVGAATFLQGRRLESVLKEVKEEIGRLR